MEKIMNKNENARRRLINAAENLLKNTDLDRLSISAITKECQMTRQVFYHYFTDKYDLIKYRCRSSLEQSLSDRAEITVKELLLVLLTEISDNFNLYRRTFSFGEGASLAAAINNGLNLAIENAVSLSTGQPASKKIKFQTGFFALGIISELNSFFDMNRRFSPEALCDDICSCAPTDIKDIIFSQKLPISKL